MNILKEKIRNREKICGTLVSLTDPCLCEIMGNVGFDCIWVDMEHTHMSYKDVLCHLNAAGSQNTPVIVRLPQKDLTATKKVLEMGADGVIFPMAKSAEEIRELIEMTLYPPCGTRGFGPLRAIGYGATDAKEYVEKESFDLCRFIQIEHIDTINELEKIVEIPYIDGFIIGPNDLSGSVDEMLNIYGEKTISCIKEAVDILTKHGKYFGFAIGMNESDIKIWSEFNPHMIFAGADWSFIYTKGKETLEITKSMWRENK